VKNFSTRTLMAIYYFCNVRVIDKCNAYIIYETAPEVMPPVLLCWPVTSEADVGSVAVEVEPAH